VTRRDLKAIGAMRIVANAAQLSIRDLRLRPLRAVIEPPPFKNESQLERAILDYLAFSAQS
jgi:hypothetical protein